MGANFEQTIARINMGERVLQPHDSRKWVGVRREREKTGGHYCAFKSDDDEFHFLRLTLSPAHEQ